jgi:hypothetical protein
VLVPYYETSSTARGYTPGIPLPKDGGILTIGYGSGGAPAPTFHLRPGQNLEVGFLKIFLSTKPIDLSSIPQSSPFERTRATARWTPRKIDDEAWCTMLIPFLRRSSDLASPQITQQKGLQEENAALKHEINSIREDILALRAELQKEKDERERLNIQLLPEQSRKC